MLRRLMALIAIAVTVATVSEQDIPGNIAKAQANWPAVLNK